MSETLQPFLHDQVVVLAAPAQAWFAVDGTMGGASIQGLYVSDVRVVSRLEYSVGDARAEHIGTSRLDAATARVDQLHRSLDGPGADPDVRSTLTRRARIDGLADEFVLTSRLGVPVETTVRVRLAVDASALDAVKAGVELPDAPSPAVVADGASWTDGDITATLSAPGAHVQIEGDGVVLEWSLTVPPRGSAAVRWSVRAEDARAVVSGVDEAPEWSGVRVTASDGRFERWLGASLDDLAALRLTTTHAPGEQFLAAGAPWFFTLFGRDSIWAARMLLPLGTSIAASTLRVLAALQGSSSNPDTAEQPGKIMHELRRGSLEIPGEGIVLPPLYYGTVDATPLWVCLLHDAWRWGMPDAEVEALLPNLEAALGWMRDFGDADGDGLLEYIDESGRGLANQGWKDSGDSVQFADGTLATGPIALVEVQAYAYEAALGGATLLERFGRPGADEWRAWAAALRDVFHEKFWLEDADGAYLAIALDAHKRPVDSMTSNAGHVLGTGLLSPAQAAVVARRLVTSDMSSGFGLRTMSTTAAGYWPLSYHGGTVWAHDTAIAVAGLTREGRTDEADVLISGLLAAAEGFDSRMPELHSGDGDVSSPLPYPAACRPQAWSAAASVVVLSSVLGLDAADGELLVSPRPTVGAFEVAGLRAAGAAVSVNVDHAGDVVAASGPVAVG
ncbi:glycogen debranching N-terminal domain-containing protein [Salinibacterium soli]|uniref:Glycogen debranching N-terminal domain-containing protein n=1 Tax=Antiquaquibacter soli TaxID=3064523 RepID=A0ABT9BQG2_9MICO|nr:glycogen debranching N-terminal domain-containing protein [Protaetiibacter sp. WY-16]MDO7883247.1 glycogen debranching N-terminal domain-containing protein [Protaetiibacter sp. WY-16]